MNGNKQGFWLAMVGVVTLIATLFTSAIADQHSRNKTSMFEESYDVSEGDALDIKVEDMDVYIEKTSGKSSVTVYVGGNNKDRAIEYFEEYMTFEAKMDGNTLRIESNGAHHGDWRFWKRYQDVDIWMIVQVPAQVDARIRTDDGDVDIDELDGKTELITEDGDIEVGLLAGEEAVIRSEDGDIMVRKIDVSGRVDIETEDGDLVGDSYTADTVILSSEDGDIEVERINASDIDVSVSDGDVQFAAEGGRLEASCSDGDVTISLLSDMDVNLTSDDGDIDLRVPRNMGAELELRGGDVHVSSKIKVNGRISDNRVTGTMNDGGKKIRARTHDGSISIRSS